MTRAIVPAGFVALVGFAALAGCLGGDGAGDVGTGSETGDGDGDGDPAGDGDGDSGDGDGDSGDGDGLPDCGAELWSTPLDFSGERVVTMPGGDVLVAGTISVPFFGQPCEPEYPLDPELTARFGRFDGVDGSAKWLNNHKTTDNCEDRGIDIAGISDGRVYGFEASKQGHFYEFGRINVIQYDADGTLITEEELLPWQTHLGNARVAANDRIFIGGEYQSQGFVAELDVDAGVALWTVVGFWGIELHEIHAFDVFANEEFAVVGTNYEVHRITQSEQVVWSTPPGGLSTDSSLEVGGPLDTVAAHTNPDVVDVFDADGTPRWQTAGTVAGVDPNGDVFVIDGSDLEKRAGADGALICTTALPLPGLRLALDEQGFPIVLDDQSITKYSP